MATEKNIDVQGKFIDEQIEELQIQLDENIREEQQCKKQAFDERGKSIDEQLEALQRQFRVEEKEEEKKRTVEHFSREEKKLLFKIESKHSIIQFLSNSLESEQKKLKDLEEQLEFLRDCKNMYK